MLLKKPYKILNLNVWDDVAIAKIVGKKKKHLKPFSGANSAFLKQFILYYELL